MKYKITRKKNHLLIIQLSGRLVGEFQTVQLNDEIEELIEKKYYHIIFDLSDLEFINSSGLTFFLKSLTRVRKFNGEVILCRVNDLLKNLMVTTKLNSFFTICNNLEEAEAHLEKEKSL